MCSTKSNILVHTCDGGEEHPGFGAVSMHPGPRVWSAPRVWRCAPRVWNEYAGHNSDLTIEIHKIKKKIINLSLLHVIYLRSFWSCALLVG